MHRNAPAAQRRTPVHTRDVITARHETCGNWFPIEAVVTEQEVARGGAVRNAAHQPVRSVPLQGFDPGGVRIGCINLESGGEII